MDEVTVIDVPTLKVAGMRKRGKYIEIANMIPALYEYVIAQGAQPMGPPIYVGHEESEEAAKAANEAGNADLEVAAPVAGEIAETGEIKSYELPGGKMAKITHKGPYQECTNAYQKLFAWIGGNNARINGPIREVYISDPKVVPEEELLTEIYAPIE
ncbi:MAG: GyrI-like domain-containing protein [Actinobacteria bacterium]|nr:GyrI-like domain-containing protein [Actinomycetota bacterium]